MYISGREREVIHLLLNAKEDVTVKGIANMLGVSERTIHRDLKGIEKIVRNHDLELVKKTGAGLHISGDSNTKQQLDSLTSNVAYSDFTPEERRAVILSTLLEMGKPIKLFTLANELKVTIATISHDLDQIEDKLASYNLALIRKRGYGVNIEGEEASKRAAISNLISTYIDPFEYVSLLKENIKNRQQADTISDRLLGLVDPAKLSVIERCVDEARMDLPHKLADSAYIGLVVHLALALERLQKGDPIQFDRAYMAQINGTKEFEIASKMIHGLKDSLRMEIPDDEIGYITMHLMGAKLRVDQHYVLEDTSLHMAYKAKELIRYISSSLKVDLTEDTALLNDLVAHLKPSIYRLKQGLVIKNPMIEEIIRDYRDLFDLIWEAVHETFPDMEFPDDEIGYLVLHFAAILLQGMEDVGLRALVICSSGIGTAKILATKLMQQIPEIKQVENKSLFDLEYIDTSNFDIIVSTITLRDFAGEYIQATPMLTQSEIHRIKKAVKKKKVMYGTSTKQVKSKPNDDFIRQLEMTQNYMKAMADVLKSFFVREVNEKQSMESILQSVCSDLANIQVVRNQESVFQKLLKRGQASGLGIPNTSLALYHTRSNDVVRPSFTVYSLHHPLTVKAMDGELMEMDTLLIMLAPETTHQEVLEVLSYLSSLLIQGEESISLFESGDESRIKTFLTNQFQTLLYEKKLL